jgi:tRNA-dihydrouridine synthase B
MSKLLRLGVMDLSSPFLLAPLESVTDSAFRKLCHQLGASFTFTEMLRASAINKGNKATIDLIDTFDSDVPTGIQLLVSSHVELMASLNTIEEMSASTHPHFNNIRAVDINFGCPSPSVYFTTVQNLRPPTQTLYIK